MTIARLRPFVAPAYLVLCLVLGGSPQGMWGSAVLQLVAIGLIAWAFVERRSEPQPPQARLLLYIVAAALLLVLVQLIPLPASLWSTLPGRAFVVQSMQLLGLQAPAMPLSLAPYATLATALTLLPPLGMLAATLGLRAYRSAWLAMALVAGAAAGVMLGILQASSPVPHQSPWYIYRISNFGVATGFFANSNHMATLLVATIPFIAALGSRLREQSSDVRARSAGLAIVAGGLLLAALGLVLNRSLAGYGLGVPVLLASLIILFGRSARWARSGLLAIAMVSAMVVALLWTSPTGSQLDRLGAASSVSSRQQILTSSLALANEYMPIGSGIGTFAQVYAMKEDPAAIDPVYVNHAHNDYVELAIEAGLPAIILMILFVGWWGIAVWRMLRSPSADQYAVAGAVVSAAILLHSLVDFPLRTAAISTVFAMCLSLILQSRKSPRSENDFRPVRHLVVG